ncbi:MAG: hypothetical protein DRJ08_03195 [Acidobacteria bacterium]|nr:MAG: hypothetical protein DRJ14_09465 [Acidobacteriota bacterium]RLE23039.1 MAG: hypothetical protein DRJ08_03195 [Acidobacteriota bacterium]
MPIRKMWNRYIQSFKGLPGASWMLALVVLINRSGSMVLVFMVLYLVHEIGVSPAEAALAISLYGIGGMGGTVLGGWLADRLGHKKIQMMSLILNGLGFMALGHLHSLLAIQLMMATIGLVAEGFRPANAAAVADTCPPDQLARGYSLNRLAVNIGATIGPAVGGVLVLAGYRFLFWVDGLTCLAAALVLFLFYHQPATGTPRKTGTVPDTRSALKDLPFLLFLSVTLVYGMLFMQLISTFPLFIDSVYGLHETGFGLLFALNAVICATVELPLITHFRHVPPLRMVTIGILLFVLGFSLLPFGNSGVFAALTVVLWTAGEILSFPQFSAMVALRAGENRRGRYMGFYSLSFSIALVLGPAIGGIVYEKLGAIPLWLSYLPIGLLMILIFHTGAKPMFFSLPDGQREV